MPIHLDMVKGLELLKTRQTGLWPTLFAPYFLLLAEQCSITFLKLATDVHPIIWPLPLPEADYQGPVIKSIEV